MWSRARRGCGGWRVLQARRMISSRPPPVSVSSAVNSMLLRSLRDHYLEVSKMTPPPKVSPPSPFSIIKGLQAWPEGFLALPLWAVSGCLGDSLRFHEAQAPVFWLSCATLPIQWSSVSRSQ
ncbi:unnamed protein product, partial [Vitis vinifera]